MYGPRVETPRRFEFWNAAMMLTLQRFRRRSGHHTVCASAFIRTPWTSFLAALSQVPVVSSVFLSRERTSVSLAPSSAATYCILKASDGTGTHAREFDSVFHRSFTCWPWKSSPSVKSKRRWKNSAEERTLGELFGHWLLALDCRRWCSGFPP
jgi:hypothetical protein